MVSRMTFRLDVFEKVADQLDDKYVIVLVGLDENSSARTSEKIVKVKRIQVGVQSVLMSHAVLLLNKMILMG